MEEEDTPCSTSTCTSSDFLKVLEALRDAAKAVEATGGEDGPSLQALLALEASSDDLLAGDAHLSTLSHLLSRLKSLSLSTSISGEGYGVRILGSFLSRRRRSGERRALACVVGAVASEIQSWIDRETIARLVAALRWQDGGGAASNLLAALESRLLSSGGFDAQLQHALLQSGTFSAVEAKLADPAAPPAVRDGCAATALALVRFNKDVFVGPVLMGPAVGAMVAHASASPAPLRALNGLVAAIRSPLVDELHARGELPRLVALLAAADLRIRALALEFALSIGYYGRKEAVDALLAEGLIKRLLCLQRSELGGALIDMEASDYSPPEKKDGAGVLSGILGFWRQRQWSVTAHRPFASAVARFAVQVEVGEGLRQREKRAAKLEILRRVREAAVSPAEEATVLAEVLWGSTP